MFYLELILVAVISFLLLSTKILKLLSYLYDNGISAIQFLFPKNRFRVTHYIFYKRHNME